MVNAVAERPQVRLNSLNRPFADRDFITESSILAVAIYAGIADAIPLRTRQRRGHASFRRKLTGIGPRSSMKS